MSRPALRSIADRLDSCYSPVSFAALTTACFLLLALRKPDGLLNPQLLAEDGVVFFRDQVLLGASALVKPYNGYLHLFPRLVAFLCAALPASWVPLAYNATGGLIQSLATAFFFAPTNRFLLRSDGLRALVCLVVVAVGPSEYLLLNNVNVQWHLFATGVLVLAYAWHEGTEIRPWPMVGYSLAALAIGLTTSLLAVIAVPAGLWVFGRARGRRQWVVAVLLLAALAQAVTFLTTAPPSATSRGPMPGESLPAFGVRAIYATAASFFYRVAIGATAGEPAARALAHEPPLAVLAAAALVLLAGLFWLLARSDGPTRGRVVVALLFAGASMGAPLVLRGLLAYFESYRGPFFLWGGGRYFVLATSIFVWLVALGLERAFPSGLLKYGLLLVVFAGGVISGFRVEAYEDFRWKDEAPRIDAWRHEAAAGGRPERLVVPIPPRGWSFALE